MLRWSQVLGVALITGISFTITLLVGGHRWIPRFDRVLLGGAGVLAAPAVAHARDGAVPRAEEVRFVRQ